MSLLTPSVSLLGVRLTFCVVRLAYRLQCVVRLAHLRARPAPWLLVATITAAAFGGARCFGSGSCSPPPPKPPWPASPPDVRLCSNFAMVRAALNHPDVDVIVLQNDIGDWQRTQGLEVARPHGG